jgi:hypothetical protein
MPQVGKAHALRAARTVTAFVHGYVTMETTGAFRLGGNVDRDFSRALDAVLRGIRTMK